MPNRSKENILESIKNKKIITYKKIINYHNEKDLNNDLIIDFEGYLRLKISLYAESNNLVYFDEYDEFDNLIGSCINEIEDTYGGLSFKHKDTNEIAYVNIINICTDSYEIEHYDINYELITNYRRFDVIEEPNPDQIYIYNLDKGYETKGFTNLMLSVLNDDKESYKILYKNKSLDYINKQTESGHNSLMLACIYPQLKDFYVEKYNFKAETKNGYTALELGCYYKNYEMVDLIINRIIK